MEVKIAPSPRVEVYVGVVQLTQMDDWQQHVEAVQEAQLMLRLLFSFAICRITVPSTANPATQANAQKTRQP